VAYQFGTSVNHANRGLIAWDPQTARPLAAGGRWEGTPDAATRMIKRAAHFLGADLVGIAPLDRRWFFSHAFWADGSHKEIVFGGSDAPVETDRQLIIPETMRWVIVMGRRMDIDTIRYTPSPIGCAETMVTYSRLALLASTMAEFVRGIGYQAIPSINDLALTIPMAIDAGFGEQGRHGKLITPEFGPSVRLCKVITDLPLVRDHPIRFGIAKFCETCLKCAQQCPSNSISKGERTWSGPNISNSSGIYTWHLDNESCRRFWATKLGDNCTICIRACPFSKGPGWIHDLARTMIARVPPLNPLWRSLDDLLGYGKQRDVAHFWGWDTGWTKRNPSPEVAE
jgi:reductive dehalogenase